MTHAPLFNETPLPSNCCVYCGAPAEIDCDHEYRLDGKPLCGRWVCWDHAQVEAQAWDTFCADGVDIRCPEHYTASEKGHSISGGQIPRSLLRLLWRC